ncbi:MAG: NUDIX domain-containing protein [Chloroflexi bacterium]|nr:NUDIX domain-containing protein [Chloroflexota bacterium]MCI0578511.1 NUDIX domain-containing protein [Chloroflexota bacterium]MCI0648472.1 NUDIX domain-containing protein [Chloroflexota bacterium]MCI0725996.1 NUDIX domain-containing protein [Chloroflexota bacterium]
MPQPFITTADGRRTFACSPAAVEVFIVNDREEILLLAHPQRNGGWEVINGALEAGESALAGCLRETWEEAGPAVRVRPLGAIHVSTFHYDDHARYMLSIAYLMAYEGGPVQPGDDMAGSRFRWWPLDELMDEAVNVIVPVNERWLLARAIELYRLWKNQEHPLQLDLDGDAVTAVAGPRRPPAMSQATLCFLVRGDPPAELLLGHKKTGFGAGRYVGAGGKIEAGETPAEAAARELAEETGVQVLPTTLEPAARLTFLFPARSAWNQVVHVFLVRQWPGEPVESREMKPVWFPASQLPYPLMWPDAPYWLPLLLQGQRLEARFTFADDNESVVQAIITPADSAYSRHLR